MTGVHAYVCEGQKSSRPEVHIHLLQVLLCQCLSTLPYLNPEEQASILLLRSACRQQQQPMCMLHACLQTFRLPSVLAGAAGAQHIQHTGGKEHGNGSSMPARRYGHGLPGEPTQELETGAAAACMPKTVAKTGSLTLGPGKTGALICGHCCLA